MRQFRAGFVIVMLLMGVIHTMAQDESTEDGLFLNNYTAQDDVLVLELETQGLIPSGADLSFRQETLVFSGDGTQFSTFSPDNTERNLLAGVTLEFSGQSDELEFCGIASRTRRHESNQQENEYTTTTIRLDAYVASGIDNEGNIFTFGRDGDSNAELALAEIDFDFSEPLHLLVIVIDDRLTVFANGEALIRDYEVTLEPGAFAFLYAGMDEDSRCRASDFFAYTIASELVDVCRASTDSVINQRSGAGTDFALVRQMQAGESIEATGQTIGSDGYIWWYLADATWVRDDVVDTSGFCRVLPEINGDS